MISNCYRVLDPLDVEILERAFDEAWAVFKEGETTLECDCDQAFGRCAAPRTNRDCETLRRD
jgi:hypothetical protein